VNSHWWIPALAYLLGSIPFGLLIVKAFGGGDIRAVGSGNIGAANVARNAGAVAGVLTLLLDAAKGYAAVWIAERWTGGNGRWMMAAAVAAVIGHMFPVWLGFKGGKGVATGLGVFRRFAGRPSRQRQPCGFSSWRFGGIRRSGQSSRRRRCLPWSISFMRRTTRRRTTSCGERC